MKKTVLIDGYNLRLTKGTGVATYSRNLSYAARDLGFNVDVLYETPASPQWDPIQNEIAFFDLPRPRPGWPLSLVNRWSCHVSSLFGIRAVHVPLQGHVLREQFQAQLPYFDRIWSAPDIFKIAHEKLEDIGLFTSVSFPNPPGIMHWTFPLPLRARNTKNIYTIHDLVPLRLPYTTLDNKRRHFKLIERIIKTADHIVTVSETSKRDICQIFNVSEDAVTNTYQSVDVPAVLRDKSEEIVRNEISGLLDGTAYKGYFLFFGAIEPKKNVGRLIEGYLASNVKTPLVIVGPEAWLAGSELRLIESLETERRKTPFAVIGLEAGQAGSELRPIKNLITERRVIRIDYVPFSFLVSLVRGAKAVLFPSLYEGFGLPVLESMLLNTPVMTSTAGSLPEIAQDAAVLVNPYNVRSIAEAITALDQNDQLREDLSIKGRKRAATFSAENYQRRLGEVYSRVLG